MSKESDQDEVSGGLVLFLLLCCVSIVFTVIGACIGYESGKKDAQLLCLTSQDCGLVGP